MNDETKTRGPRTKETAKTANVRLTDELREMLLDLNDFQEKLVPGANIPLSSTLHFAVVRAHQATFGKQHSQAESGSVAVPATPASPAPEPERPAPSSKFTAEDL